MAERSISAAPKASMNFAPSRAGVLRRKCDCGQHTGGSACADCSKRKQEAAQSAGGMLQRRTAGTGGEAQGAITVPPIVHDVLRSPGQPLDSATRSFFEPRLGYDFSGVRIHTDARAAESARAVNALAYTVGSDIVFGTGHFAPAATNGKRLLAHELSHVQQQSSKNFSSGQMLEIQSENSALEREAEQAAVNITQSELPTHPRWTVPRIAKSLQRACPKPPTGLGATPSTEACALQGPAAVAGNVLLFCQDSDELTGGQTAWLAKVISDAKTATKIEIHGNASVEGPAGDYNVNLACKRAAAVAAKLRTAGVTAPISIFTHGPTTVYGGGEANRNVVVTLTTPPVTTTPAAKAEEKPATPAPPAGPQFVCGPDVTKAVSDAVSKTKTTFAGWSSSDQSDACDALTSLITGGAAWDIVDLHNNAWILTYRPACATEKATPPCGSSVQIGNDCYYAGSVNYVIFGVMCDLCDKHYTALGSSKAADFKLAGMLKLIDEYKGTGFTGLQTPSANFVPSQEWATAGFYGWPSGTTAAPAADKPGCLPKCSSPYAGAPFSVHWIPKGVF